MEMSARLEPTLTDTNAILALLDRKDVNHNRAKAVLPAKLLIPSLVLPEVDYLASTRLGSDVAKAFLRGIVRGDMQVIYATDTDFQRSLELQEQYADLELGLVDSSIIAAAERLGIRRIFTFDRRHFSAVQPRDIAFLELLPF
jgi:uncharacterized protein